MGEAISVVINTYNEAEDLERLLKSVKWADEIIVCDMYSDDKTVQIAKRLGAKVIFHKKLSHVEPARNFAIEKASGDWILIIDPDEEIPADLKDRLIQISERMEQINYVRIPRKNLIFGKWVQSSMWWPDFNIRFFRKGKVTWSDKIHRPPQVSGEGIDLPAEDKWAIVHYHYQTISQYLERMIRYTKVQALELHEENYKFVWIDLIQKPLGEFLSRFFACKGYSDGIHGLALSLLQAFSHFVLYLRVWEIEKFQDNSITINEIETLSQQSGKEITYWIHLAKLSKNPLKRFAQKIKNKI